MQPDEARHPGFCRDCLTGQPSGNRRCKHCGSPRLLYHDELYRLTLAHIDCDAFYASVEKRDNPELADKPVIIGGGKRGVVSTACYIARIHGVRSAMPMFKALEACPQAIVIKPDMEKYVRVGRQIRTMMQELTPLVQPLSIDEAFLELKGTEHLHHDPPARVLARFARRIEQEIGPRTPATIKRCLARTCPPRRRLHRKPGVTFFLKQVIGGRENGRVRRRQPGTTTGRFMGHFASFPKKN